MFNTAAAVLKVPPPQVGLREEARLHQRGEGEGATEAQV